MPCPKMDIGAAFSTIAAKALGIAGFFPYNTDLNFLLGEPSGPASHSPAVVLMHVEKYNRAPYVHHTPFGCKSL